MSKGQLLPLKRGKASVGAYADNDDVAGGPYDFDMAPGPKSNILACWFPAI